MLAWCVTRAQKLLIRNERDVTRTLLRHFIGA